MSTREDILSLAPCPFCGGGRIETSYIRDGRSIGCRDCGASLHQFNGLSDINKRLAKAWNRRAAPTPPAAEAPGQEPVAVKPLEWKPVEDARYSGGVRPGHFAADIYRITAAKDGMFSIDDGRFSFLGAYFASIGDAMATALDDYEQRIRSALVSAPPTYADVEAKGFERGIETAAKWLEAQVDEGNAMIGMYPGDPTGQIAVEVSLLNACSTAIRSLASPAPKGET